MAKVKSYVKVAKETLVNGENWQEVYDELSKISLETMKSRIQIIDEECKKMESEIVRRQTRVRAGMDGKDVDQDANTKAVEEMLRITTELQGERNILEAFPSVDKKIKTIKSTKARAEKRKAKEQEEAKKRLEAVQAKEKELKAREEEIDEQIREAEDTMKSVKSKALKSAMEQAIKDLNGEKDKLGTMKDIKREVLEAKAEVRRYSDGKTELDEVIAKCENPWEGIFKGMGWKAVSSLSEGSLKEMIKLPKAKQNEEKDNEDKNKDENKDREQESRAKKDEEVSGKAGSRSAGASYENEEEEEEQQQEQEQEEQDTETDRPAKITIFQRFKNWREKRKEEREERKAREELFKREFRDKYKGDPSFLDRLCIRYPKLGKFLGRDYSDMNFTFEKQLKQFEQIEEEMIFHRVGKTEEQKRADLEAYMAAKSEEEVLAGEEAQLRASEARLASQKRLKELAEKEAMEEAAAIEARRKALEQEKAKKNAWKDSLKVGKETEEGASKADETSGEKDVPKVKAEIVGRNKTAGPGHEGR